MKIGDLVGFDHKAITSANLPLTRIIKNLSHLLEIGIIINAIGGSENLKVLFPRRGVVECKKSDLKKL